MRKLKLILKVIPIMGQVKIYGGLTVHHTPTNSVFRATSKSLVEFKTGGEWQPVKIIATTEGSPMDAVLDGKDIYNALIVREGEVFPTDINRFDINKILRRRGVFYIEPTDIDSTQDRYDDATLRTIAGNFKLEYNIPAFKTQNGKYIIHITD